MYEGLLKETYQGGNMSEEWVKDKAFPNQAPWEHDGQGWAGYNLEVIT